MKKFDTDSAFALLVDVVKNNLRHRDYERVTHMASNLTRLITGEDMQPLMRRFDRRESESQFKQRCEITQHITSTVCQNLMKPAYKIPRSNGVRRVLMYSEDAENKRLKEFEAILGKFWGTKSLDDYMGERWIELTYSDPNSFIVYEWDAFDGNTERAQPYPFEVSAHEAIYYKYNNNILQYIVVMNEFEKGAGGIPEKVQESADGKNVTKRYTIYYAGGSVTLDELDTKEVDALMPKPQEQVVVEINGLKYYSLNDKVYLLGTYDSGLDFIPVVRVGFRHDIGSRGRTCISPINEAVPILMKTIKANSELDLTMALHAHPQRLQYLQECTADKCNGGRLPDGAVCGTCKGTGMKETPTTAQESIDLKMPRDKEDMVALDNIVRYLAPPVDLVTFQDNYIKSLTAQCKEAIYNSEIFSRQQIAETATGKNIDLQNVYDSLYTMARAFSATWEYSVNSISKITDMDDKLVSAYIFSRDFKMKSLNDLYNDLKVVADSKAPSFIKQGIYDDIARIIYTDDPVQYDKYRTKEYFFPYTGKSEEEIMSITATLPPTNFERVLWESYGWIFSDIERRYTERGENFYELSRSRQWTQVEKEINKVIKDREANLPNFKQEISGD